MTTMSGLDVIERYHRAIAIGDYDTVTALHAPEVVVWMSGRSIVSGRFQGREALFEHMTHHVLGPLQPEAEDYVKGVRIVVADGDYVVAILHGGLPNKVGGRYDQYYLQVFRMGDGLIQEIVEIFDTVMFEQAVIGHHLEIPRERPAAPFVIAPPPHGAADRATMHGLATEWLAAVVTADEAEASALLTADCTLEVIGTTPLSGVAGFDASRLRTILAGGIGWSRLVCADRSGAVALMRSADPAYGQQYGVVLEADGDRIGRISLFEDTVEAEARLHANPMLPEATRSIMPVFDLRAALSGG
jgi:ketosteroid isomerase-like protein